MPIKSIQIKRYITHTFIQNTTVPFPTLSTTIYKALTSTFLPEEIVYISSLKKYGIVEKQESDRRKQNNLTWYKINIIRKEKNKNKNTGENKSNNENSEALDSKSQFFKFSNIERIEGLTKNDIMNYLFTITNDTPFGKVLKSNVLKDLKRLEEKFRCIKFEEILCETSSDENEKEVRPTKREIIKEKPKPITENKQKPREINKNNAFSKKEIKSNTASTDRFSVKNNISKINATKQVKNEKIPVQPKNEGRKIMPKPDTIPENKLERGILPLNLKMDYESKEKMTIQKFGKKLIFSGLLKKEIGHIFEIATFLNIFNNFLEIKRLGIDSFVNELSKKNNDSEYCDIIIISILKILADERKEVTEENFLKMIVKNYDENSIKIKNSSLTSISSIKSQDNIKEDATIDLNNNWYNTTINKNNFKTILQQFLTKYAPVSMVSKQNTVIGKIYILKFLIDSIINSINFRNHIEELIENSKIKERAKTEAMTTIKKKTSEIKQINDYLKERNNKIALKLKEKQNDNSKKDPASTDVPKNKENIKLDVIEESKYTEDDIKRIKDEIKDLEKEICENEKWLLENRFRAEIGKINDIPFFCINQSIFFYDKEIFHVEETQFDNIIKFVRYSSMKDTNLLVNALKTLKYTIAEEKNENIKGIKQVNK